MTKLLENLESDRVELKRNFNNSENIREAVCAFANDLPDHRKPGYVIIGVEDDGSPAGLAITDELMRNLADMRTDGNISPPVSLFVERVPYQGVHAAVVTVHPSNSTPVRFKGRTCIRIGTRRAYATIDEEKRLAERAVHMARPFDRRPCPGATINDILVDIVRTEYLPKVVATEIIAANQRTPEDWLSSLRFFDAERKQPTHAGILVYGRDPLPYIPGAYVQFVRFDGTDPGTSVVEDKTITGNLATQLRQLDELLPLHSKTSRRPTDGMRNEAVAEYPKEVLRELVLNAIMHRTYEGTNAPVRIHWFMDRVEILNPGGLYGQVTPESFGRVSDYRNPTLAEALKALGYVDRYGSGIEKVRRALAANGNPPPEFEFQPTHFLATARART